MTSELRPCPFCSAKMTLKNTDFSYCGSYPHLFNVVCMACGASGPVADGETHEKARANAKIAWNRRGDVN